MMAETVYWTAALVALVGAWLNVCRVACYYLLCASIAVWACAEYMHGFRTQAMLLSVFLGVFASGIPKRRIVGGGSGDEDAR